MPLIDEAPTRHALTDPSITDQAFAVAAPDVPSFSTARAVAAAALAFVAVFLISVYSALTVRDAGWGNAVAAAGALGTVGAGLQLMLGAVRRRRALEGISQV